MERKFWNEAIETLSGEELREWQWKKLRKQMPYLYNYSEFYRKQFRTLGIHPDEIKNIEEFNTVLSLDRKTIVLIP